MPSINAKFSILHSGATCRNCPGQ